MALLEYVVFIKRGKNRKKVFIALDKPMMPSEIVSKLYGKASNTYFNIVSRALAELKEKRIIEVMNPKDNIGRIYKKTALGLKVQAKLAKMS